MQARNSSGHEARAQPSQRRSPIGEAEGKQSHTKPQPSLARFRVRLQAPCSVTPSHATERPSRQPPRWLCKQPWALMCLRPSSTAPRCPVTTLRSRSANVASSSPPSASGISCIALEFSCYPGFHNDPGFYPFLCASSNVALDQHCYYWLNFMLAALPPAIATLA